eukprot:NODE_1093_length_1471_cov_75.309524_g1082_i0.p1 GENE.NODE_1093_length_1471_cov_75.309524_g1082_i0~~NODE_1093_length_1471_cov_75.309524_g1082_i0.p1  ORF type:complete len:410 (+),score=68.79 NODE_1093_length_1471_cov_75.309524_g1082_i0:78-1307(+)
MASTTDDTCVFDNVANPMDVTDADRAAAAATVSREGDASLLAENQALRIMLARLRRINQDLKKAYTESQDNLKAAQKLLEKYQMDKSGLQKQVKMLMEELDEFTSEMKETGHAPPSQATLQHGRTVLDDSTDYARVAIMSSLKSVPLPGEDGSNQALQQQVAHLEAELVRERSRADMHQAQASRQVRLWARFVKWIPEYMPPGTIRSATPSTADRPRSRAASEDWDRSSQMSDTAAVWETVLNTVEQLRTAVRRTNIHRLGTRHKNLLPEHVLALSNHLLQTVDAQVANHVRNAQQAMRQSITDDEDEEPDALLALACQLWQSYAGLLHDVIACRATLNNMAETFRVKPSAVRAARRANSNAPDVDLPDGLSDSSDDPEDEARRRLELANSQVEVDDDSEPVFLDNLPS